MDEAFETRGGVGTEAGEGNLGSDQQERQENKPSSRFAQRRLGRLPSFWTIGKMEREYVARALRAPLSGYLGGISRAGYWVDRLSDEWSSAFQCRYSIPCNSATSGLLAACMAAGIGQDDTVWTSTYTMSATATCAMILGAQVKFLDINPHVFTMTMAMTKPWPKAIIVTNLFGHAADLKALRAFCDEEHITLIEDNAQAPFATDDGKYAGTIGHIGVFSLNVHKHLQTGEGGIITTDDPGIAHRLDCAINHGELMKVDPHLGLNLRMTEPIAAIASAQLKKGSHIVQGRINLAHKISSLFEGVHFVEPPQTRGGCDHVYYLWAGKIKGEQAARKRKGFLAGLQSRDLPFREGYSRPLHRIFGGQSDKEFPVTVEMEDERLFTFEICAYDPNAHHLRLMRQIILEEAEKSDNEFARRGCQ